MTIQNINEIELPPGITEYQFELQKKKPNGRYEKIASGIDGSEDIKEVAKERYGTGKYRFTIMDKDGEMVDGWDIQDFEIKEEKRTIENTIPQEKKSTKDFVKQIHETVQDELTLQSALKMHQGIIGIQEQKSETPNNMSDFLQFMTTMNQQTQQMMIQQQQQSQQFQSNLLLALNNKKDNSTEILLESMKMMAESFKPKESKLEKAISNFMESPIALSLIEKILHPRETSLDKAVPILIERAASSSLSAVENCMKIITENSKNQPPIDYDKKSQSNLYLAREITSMSVKAIKDIAGIFFSPGIDLSKTNPLPAPQQQPAPQQPAPQQPAPQQPAPQQPAPQQPAPQQPAPQQPAPQQPAPQQPAPQKETEQETTLKIQQDFSNAINIIKENIEKPTQEIAKLLLSNANIASYVMANYPKQEIIANLKNAKIEETLLQKIEQIIDLFQTKDKE